MWKMEIRIKKLVPEAVVPKKAHASDAGFDLVATSVGFENGVWVCHSGLAFEIPEGYVGLVFPRSSIVKKDMSLANAVGVIDSHYRGEVTGRFRLAGNIEYPKYEVGERFCQMIIIPYPEVSFVVSDELSETDRGNGGYGSTGK